MIEFYKRYGTKATKDAYGISEATIFRWKKRLKDNQGRLESLIQNSKSPKRKRQMLIHLEIINFIPPSPNTPIVK